MSAFPLRKAPPVSLLQNSLSEKNFGLTEAEFKQLANSLTQGDQRLFERVFLAHYKDCLNYLVRKDGLAHAEAYDLTMDTLLLFRDLIIAGKIRYGNLRYLFTRMARQAHLRGKKKKEHLTGMTNSCLEFPEDEPELSQEEFDILGRAFKSLGKECKHLLRAHYYLRRSLKDIATEEDRAPATVRKQKSRCVATLRRYFHHIS